jgi:hypothetical protein
MAEYVEEKEFVLRLEARVSFPDDYQGEEDGFEWEASFRALAAEVVRAATHALASHPTWTLRPRNRGRSTGEEVTLVLERSGV